MKLNITLGEATSCGKMQEMLFMKSFDFFQVDLSSTRAAASMSVGEDLWNRKKYENAFYDI